MGQDLVIEEKSGVRVDEVIAMTARLARLMGQEIQLVKTRRFRETEALQEEKLRLVEMLEAIKREIQRDPSLAAGLGQEEREDFRSVYGVFEQISRENYESLRTAQDVNAMVIEAIREAVAEQLGRVGYGASGKDAVAQAAPSLKLNEVI